MDVEKIIDEAIGREGGYADHPDDRGGPTMWGITQAVARANGFKGDMRGLPRATAVAIYRKEYVEGPGFDQVGARAPAVAAELVDTGINMGPKVAATFLQRALNVLNRGGGDWGDIGADGRIGPATLRALDRLLAVRGQDGAAVLLKALNCLQGARYIELAEAREKNESFLFGWLRTRVAL